MYNSNYYLQDILRFYTVFDLRTCFDICYICGYTLTSYDYMKNLAFKVQNYSRNKPKV